MTPAGALALKLILTPLLVGGASLAGRRWGSGVGGWLIGMPFTSAPIAFFLALDPGPRFAAGAAAGIMAGTASQAAFCLAYSWVAQRSGWAASLAAAAIAFAAATIVLDTFILPAPAFFVVTIVVLVVSLFLMPGQATRSARQVAWSQPLSAFDLRSPPRGVQRVGRRLHEEHTQSGTQLVQLVYHSAAAKCRHLDISQDKIDFTHFLGGDPKCHSAV